MSKKLTDQELQEIHDIRKIVTEVASILGDLNYQKLAIDLAIDEQKARIQEIKRRESEIFEKIRNNYGNVSVNLETGDID